MVANIIFILYIYFEMNFKSKCLKDDIPKESKRKKERMEQKRDNKIIISSNIERKSNKINILDNIAFHINYITIYIYI